ncbi:hypothetical protein [Methanospirillum sp.]|uniref:hypothetical protein n=1 Tax=Methanospirillum sp. TaxID=45200 RepID=UPI0035A0B5A6
MAQLLGNKKKDDFSQLLGKTDNKNQGFDLRFRNTNSISYDSKIGLDNYSVPLLFRENQINTSTITRGIYADLNGIVSEYNTVIPDPESVVAYLQKHYDLIDTLWKVAKFTSDTYQSPNEISIEIRYGDDSSDIILAVFVRMIEYPENIFDELDIVCEKFESDLITSEGFILLTTDFQPPKYSNGISVV